MGLTLLVRALFAGDRLGDTLNHLPLPPSHTPDGGHTVAPSAAGAARDRTGEQSEAFWPQVLIVPLGVRSVSDVDITWVQAGCVGSFLLFFYLLEVCLKINICCLHLLP